MAAFHCKEQRVNVRQIAGGLAVLAAFIMAPMTVAQKNTSQTNTAAAPAAEAAANAHWNFGALVQSGFGVTEERGDFKFLLIGGHAGRMLTPNLGGGLPQGQLRIRRRGLSALAELHPEVPARQMHADLSARRAVWNLCCLFSRIHGWRNVHRRQCDTGHLPLELHARRAVDAMDTGRRRRGLDEPQVSGLRCASSCPRAHHHRPAARPVLPRQRWSQREHKRVELHTAVRRRNPLFRPPATVH